MHEIIKFLYKIGGFWKSVSIQSLNFHYLIIHWWGNLRFLPFCVCRSLQSSQKFWTPIRMFYVSGFLLGINVYWRCFQKLNTFQDFVTYRLNLAHFIYFLRVLMAFGASRNLKLWTLSDVYDYTLCSCDAVGSFCAFERELPGNVVGTAGDICLSGR